MTTPIFFVHKTDSFYLKYSLLQAKKFNNNSEIILLGDESNNNYDFITHANIKDYYSKAQNFEKVYKHKSTNSYEYELLCFQRWFIIYEYMLKHNIQNCFYQDSDLLLYCNVSDEQNSLDKYDLAFVDISGHSIFINNMDSLGNLCNFISDCYTEQNLYNEIENIYKEYKLSNSFGGICDMTLLTLYKKKNRNNVAELSEIRDESVFDNNFNQSEGYEYFYSTKKIKFVNNLPYSRFINSGKYIRFKTIHFQGKAKFLMKYFYEENKLKNLFIMYLFYKNLTINKIKDTLRPIRNSFLAKE